MTIYICNISQNASFCSQDADFCIENVRKRQSDCKISCDGLYSVVWYQGIDHNMEYGQKFTQMTSEYHRYLNNYAENLVYNSSSGSLSKNFSKNSPTNFCFLSASPKGFPPLHLVQIFFVPASYDEIERDIKLTLEAQLGLIGGTMGLLTGFSILSGVEILYYIINFLMSLRFNRWKICSA